jgi:hypothetical protein
MASNHLAFHLPDALQNAQALAAVHYQFNNQKAVVLSSLALAYQVNAEISRTRIAPVILETSTHEIHMEAPVVKAPVIVDHSIQFGKVEVPITANSKNSAVTAKQRLAIAKTLNPTVVKPITVAKVKKPQYVWKHGHGAIEKVDRRTGEIFHLCEVGKEEQVAA